jgi:hypothetical protein
VSGSTAMIHFSLQELISLWPKGIPYFLITYFMKKKSHKGLEEVSSDNISWQLLHGKTRDPDSKALFS